MPDVYDASDYAGMFGGQWSFYYGYELEKDGQWAFQAMKDGKEVLRLSASELNVRDSYDPIISLLKGIAIVLEREDELGR